VPVSPVTVSCGGPSLGWIRFNRENDGNWPSRLEIETPETFLPVAEIPGLPSRSHGFQQKQRSIIFEGIVSPELDNGGINRFCDPGHGILEMGQGSGFQALNGIRFAFRTSCLH
jgi:hypothetical protein